MGEKRPFRNSDWAKTALGKASIPQWFENGSSHVEVNDYPNDLREVEIRCASLENFPYDVAFIIAVWEPVGRFFWCRLTHVQIFVEMFFGKWTWLEPVAPPKTSQKQQSVSALFGGTWGGATRPSWRRFNTWIASPPWRWESAKMSLTTLGVPS